MLCQMQSAKEGGESTRVVRRQRALMAKAQEWKRLDQRRQEQQQRQQRQVIPPRSHFLDPISPMFPPFFPAPRRRFLRLAEAVPTSPKPEPRAKKRRHEDKSRDLGPSFDTPDA